MKRLPIADDKAAQEPLTVGYETSPLQSVVFVGISLVSENGRKFPLLFGSMM